MTLSARDIVGRARSLTGTPFRPQGRDPRTGLDCVGLAMHAFAIPAESIRRDYRLRGAHREEMERELLRFFRRIPVTKLRPGDLLVCAVSAQQLHLAVQSDRAFIHADARLRRIVETPGKPAWPIASAFRRRIKKTS